MDAPGYGPPDIKPGKLRLIEQRIPGLVLDRIGGTSWQEATGTLHDLPLKLVYRERHARLKVGGEPYDTAGYEAELEYGTIRPNSLSATSWLDLFCRIVPLLKRGRVLWEFRGLTTRDYRYLGGRNQTGQRTGQPERYRARAATAEEALAILRRILGPEEYERAQINPQPVENNDWRWPSPEPIFVVLPEAPPS